MSKKNNNINNPISSYEIKGAELKLKYSNNNIKAITFDYPIRQVVQFNDRLLIRLEPSIGNIFNENVYCYSSCYFLLYY